MVEATQHLDREQGSEQARSAAIYRKAVEKTFSFLKATRRLDELMVKGITLPSSGGMLVPVCELHAHDTALVERLGTWRAENAFAFPSQFPVTFEGTEKWLRNKVLDVPDRILFLALDRFGTAVGHLGFANALNDECAMEIDNVVRGAKKAEPGIMSEAMKALLKWARETIGPQSVFLRVFSDNTHAIEFYRRLGFAPAGLIPLRRHTEGNAVLYDAFPAGDAAPPDKHYLRMIYRPPDDAGKELILTAGPSVSARETWYAFDAARSGWNHKWSGYLTRFEKAFCDYLGVPHAMATSSCTGALHIALLALGVGPGDEVIVPDMTWVATANAVVYVGATPIFADVQADTWCMDPDSFESCITERTKAVIPVHLYGHPAQMDRIVDIARKHKLYIVEDAAPALGAEFLSRKAGSFGDFAAFSFQGAKLLVTGEGGMLLTSNPELYDRAYRIWDQGRRPGTFWIEQTGYKYKMSNLQAAFGLGQLERIDELVESKRRIFSWYKEGLDGAAGIRLNTEASWARSICWMSSILLDEAAGIGRDELRKQLRERNIDTRPAFPAVSQFPVWPKPQPPQPNSLRIGSQAINLPSGVCLRREQVDYICRTLCDILSQ